MEKNKDVLKTSTTTALDKLEDFSIVLWYRSERGDDGGAYEPLIFRNYNNESFSVGLHDCKRVVFVWDSRVWEYEPFDDCEEYAENQKSKWNHLVCAFESKTNTMKLFKNGKYQGSDDKKYASPKQKGDLIIGQDFKGKIDDIIIFNKSLNEAEVKLMYNLDSVCL